MKNKKSIINNQNFKSGFTLIEVIIAMFMLTALIVFYASALNLVALSRRVRVEDLAYHVANKEMETLRDTALASLPASGTISDPMLGQLPSGMGTFTVTNYPGYSGMKEIVVTVTWTDSSTKTVELRTLAGTGGINP